MRLLQVFYTIDNSADRRVDVAERTHQCSFVEHRRKRRLAQVVKIPQEKSIAFRSGFNVAIRRRVELPFKRLQFVHRFKRNQNKLCVFKRIDVFKKSSHQHLAVRTIGRKIDQHHRLVFIEFACLEKLTIGL